MNATRALAVLIGFFIALTAYGAQAQTYPAREHHAGRTYPPGGGVDALARMVADRLSPSR